MNQAFFIAAFFVATPACAETAFFAEIPDLPLPPGFAQTTPGMSFESERGRIVVAEAIGAGEMLAVRDFYLETLPHLGWGESAEDEMLVFIRGRERLHFYIERVDGRIRLRAQLAIAPAAMD